MRRSHRLGTRTRPLVALVVLTAWLATLLVAGPTASASVAPPPPAPTAFAVGAPQGNTDPTFTFDLQLPTDTAQCVLVTGTDPAPAEGDSAWTNCTSPWTPAVAVDGTYTGYARTERTTDTDVVDPSDSSTSTITETLYSAPTAGVAYVKDTTGPAVTLASGPTGTGNTAAVTWVGDAGAFDVTCTLTRDGAPYATARCDAGAPAFPAAPLSADGSYELTGAATDGDGNTTSTLLATYVLDRTAPTVSVSPATAGSDTAGAGWTVTVGAGGQPATCVLANDTPTTIDSGPCSGFTSYTLPAKDTYTLTATTTDLAGNPATDTATWYYEDTPAVSVTSPAVTGNDSPITWTLAADAPVVCTLTDPDGIPTPVVCSPGPVETDVDAKQGTWTFTATATVAPGLTATDSATYVFDDIAPAAFTVTGTTGTRNTTTVAWSWTPAGATCQLISTTDVGYTPAAPASCGGTSYTTALPGEGGWQLVVTLTDAAGNSTTAYSPTVLVDLTAPVAPGVSTPVATDNVTAPVWTLTGEAGATYACSWTADNTATPPVSGPCTSGYAPTLPPADGTYTLAVTQTDVAGNTSPAATEDYTLDLTAPVVVFTADPTGPSTDPDVTWTTTSDPDSAAIACRLIRRTAGGDQQVYDWRACGRTVSETLSAGDGTYLLTVRDTDAVGNVDPAGTESTGYVLDTTGPGAPTVSGSNGFDNDPDVSWTITPPSGEVPNGYSCSLVKDNVQGAWTACDSLTYDTTLTGEGTYRLDVVATDALDNESSPVSSSLDYVYDTSAPSVATFVGTAGTGNTPSRTWTWTEPETGLTADCRLYTVDGVRTLVGTATGCTSPHTEFLSSPTTGTTYVLEVTLVDQAGNDTAADGPSYLLDTVAPVAPSAVSGASGTDNIAGVTPYTFTLSEGGGTVVCQLMQRPKGSSTWTAIQTSGVCTSPWSPTIPSADGDYTVRVTQTDAAGNASLYGESATYTLDVTGPVAPVFTAGPTGTDNVKPATWTWTSEALSTALCSVTHDGVEIVAPEPCNGGSYSTTLGDGDGVYRLIVELTDQYGNVGGSTTSAPYTLDATAPGAPVVNGPSVTDNDTTADYAIVGPVEPGATAECRLTRDGTTTVSNWASCTLPTNLTLGVDGSYVLDVRLTDQYGNLGPAGASPAYLLDTTAPVVSVTPANQASTDGDTSFAVSVTGGPAASCVLTSPVALPGDTYGDGTTDCANFTSISLPRKGTYTLTASSTDAAGNTGTDTGQAIYRDAPTVTVTPNRPTGNTTSVTWTLTATSGTTLACTLVGPGDPLHSVACGSGSATTTVSSTEGTSTFTAVATDPQTGFTGTGSATYVYDVTAPDAFTVTGTSGDRNTTAVTWSWSATDTTSACQLRKSGVAFGAVVTPCLTDWTTALPGEGSWDLAVTLTDAAGNSTTAVGPEVRVDLTAPAAPGVSTTTYLSNNRSPVWTLTGEATATFACSWTSTNASPLPADSACTTGYAPTLPAADGVYTLHVVQTDIAGNPGPEQTKAYTLDLTDPVVTFTVEPTSPANGTTVSWTTTVSEPTVTTECRLVKRTSGADLVVYDWRTLGCSRTVSATLIDGDGTYELQVRDTDAAGNVTPAGTASAPFVLDTTGPGTPTVNGPSGWNSDPDVTWTIDAPSGEVPDGYYCRLVRNGNTAPATWVRCDSQTFSTTLPNEATYRLDVESVDALGNRSTPTTSSADYLFDPNPPTAAVFAGADSTGNTTTHAWTWTEGEPQVTADCRLFTVAGATRTLVRTTLGCTSPRTETLAASTPGTTYVLEVTLVDRAGNSTAADGPAYLLDTVAPVAPAVSGPSGTNSVRAATYAFVPSEPGTVAICNLMQRPLNSTTWASVQTASPCATPWSVTLPAVDGDYATRVTLTDAAGNTSAYGESETYALDLTGPDAPVFTAAPSNTDNVPSVTWTWTHEALSTGVCTLAHGGATVGTPTACNAGTYSTTLTAGDGPYTLTVQLTDQYGNVGGTTTSVVYTLDLTPPGAPSVSGPSTTSNNTTADYALVGPVEPGATAECRLERDGSVVSDWTPCTLPTSRSLSGDGTYVFKVRLTDQYGNLGAAGASPGFLLDTTLPQVPVVTPPPSPSQNAAPVFSIVIDSDTSASCQLARGSVVVAAAPSCGSTFTGSLSGLADGDYVLTVASRDAAGNVATGSSAAYTYDTTAPVVPAVSGPPGPSQIRTPAFSWTSEPGARSECSTKEQDGAASGWGACSSPYAPTLPTDGTWVLSVRLIDAAGNVSGVGSSGGYLLDTTAPDAPSVTAPASPGRNLAPSWSAAVEPGSTTECRFTGPDQTAVAFTGCLLPLTTPITSDGQYTFEVRATDAAGNISPAGSGTYVLDTTAPAAPVVNQPTGPGRSRTPSISYTAEAGTVGACRLTRGSTVLSETGPCTSPVQLNLNDLPDGAYTLTVRAVDAAGNTGPAATGTYVLDTTAPAPPIMSLIAGSPSSDRAPVYAFNAEASAVLGCRITTPGGLVKDLVCTSPLTLDLSGSVEGTYVLAVTARDAAGNTSAAVVSEYVLDNSAPAAPHIVGPVTPGSSRTPSWRISSGSPTECRLLRGTTTFKDWAPCGSTYTADLYGQADAVYLLEARVVGTTAQTTSRYRLDTAGPGAASITAPPSPSTVRKPTWAIASTEPVVTAECRVTVFGGVLQDWAPCAVSAAGSLFSYDLTGLGDGVYTLAVRLTDNAGNVGTVATSDYELDTSAPAAVGVVGPPSPGNDPTPTWTISSTSGVKLECRLTSGQKVIKDFAPCAGTYTADLTGLPDATYTLTVHALSPAGTPGPETTSSYDLDTTAASAPTALTTSEPKTSRNRTPVWTFVLPPGSTAICTITYGGSVYREGPCTSPYTMDLTTGRDGSYVLKVIAVDKAGNRSAPTTAGYTLRTTAPPEPEFTLEPGSPSSTVDPRWAFSSAYDVTTECRTLHDGVLEDSGAWFACPKGHTMLLTGKPDGRYTLQVRAVDVAGNLSKPVESSYEFDRSAGPLAVFLETPVSPGTDLTPTWIVSAPTAPVTTTAPALLRASALTVSAVAVECRFSKKPATGSWTPCAGSYTATTSGDGAYFLDVRTAGDAPGPASRSTYVLDTARPAPLVFTDTPPAVGNDGEVSWSWDDNPLVRVQCRFFRAGATGGSFSVCDSPYTVDVTRLGQAGYTLEAQVIDLAGNVSDTATGSYRYDTTPPPAPVFASKPPARGSASSVTWTFSVPAGASAVCVVTHDGTVTESPCAGTFSLSRLTTPGTWSVSVRYVDEAGNVGASTVGTYTLTTAGFVRDRVDGQGPGSGSPSGPRGGAGADGGSDPSSTPGGPTFGPPSEPSRAGAVARATDTIKKAVRNVVHGVPVPRVGIPEGTRVPDAIKNVIGSTITKPQLPLALFVIVVLFLLVQNRIDRRDPKLAAAPVAAEPELEFGPRVGFLRTGGATA